MDETLHDRTAERHEAPAESGDGSKTPEAGNEIVTVCGWCAEVNILKLQRRAADVILIFQQGKRLAISRNGIPLKISHSMCDKCRAEKFPETVKRKDGQS